MLTSVEECSVLSGQHYKHAFRILLGQTGHPGSTLLASGGVMLISGGEHPLSNSVIGASKDELEPCIDALIACEMPSMVVCTEPRDQDHDEIAEARGYVCGTPTPTMAVEIERLAETPLPPQYTFERMKAADDFAAWTQAASKGFRLPISLVQMMSPPALVVDDAPTAGVQFFQVRLGVEIAGLSMMLLGHGVAGMYTIATLPDHRGRGLGAFLTAEPLRQARALGYRIGVLQASSLGHPVYQRIGFQDVGTIRMLTRLPGSKPG